MSHASIASYLNTKQPYHPKVGKCYYYCYYYYCYIIIIIGIICGSGLSGLSKHLTKSITINYEDIPGNINI